MTSYQITKRLTLNDAQKDFLRKLSIIFDCHLYDIFLHIEDHGYMKRFMNPWLDNNLYKEIADSYFKENAGL